MSDDENIPEKTGTDPTAEEQKFTQADLDRLIKDRLDKAERAHRKELSEVEAKHKTELDRLKMDESERAKAEAEDERNALIKRAEDAESALRLTKAEKELSSAGLPTELAAVLLNGAKDEKSLTAAIKAIADASTEKGNKLYADKVGGHGAPSAPSTNNSDDLYQQMRKSAGLK